MKIRFLNLPLELYDGVAEVQDILGLECSEDGIPVEVARAERGLMVSFRQGRGTIAFSRRVEFFRGLGLLAENLQAGAPFCLRQEPVYDNLGAMFDNSRNAVMKTETVKKLIRHLALMGYHTLMLYTEDTYEVKEYPYFGYMRGRLTAQEVRECDRYAQMMGVELVPCVQTLAHLNAIFRWPVFQPVNDLGDILLVGEEETYNLLDAMLKSIRGMYSSRSINIGMDEAHMVGLGKYLDRHGYVNRFDLMVEHLNRVVALCKKYDFKPMMWSDMFFRLLFSDYHKASEVGRQHTRLVPKDVTLIYWDYYSEDPAVYDRNIENHQKFENPIAFAGGAWKWTGLAPGNHFSFHTSRMALESCRRHGIRQVMVTGWGDDGAECSAFAILPVLQLFAEDCYGEDTGDAQIAKRLRTCAKAHFDDFMALDTPNLLPGNEPPGRCSVNPSKYLLFQDPLCGLFDRHVGAGQYNAFYERAAVRLEEAAARNPEWAYIFRTSASLCHLLALKCDLGVRIRAAYQGGDRGGLETILHSLPELIKRVEALHSRLREQWMAENKVFGLEVQDIRYGALKERLRAAGRRLEDCLSGRVPRIEELDEPRLDYRCRTGGNPHVGANLWREIVTPNLL